MRRSAPSPGPAVLVVDDEPSLRKALGASLADSYVVYSAATGGEALALLARHPVAAIILDAVLGHEGGLDLIPRIPELSTAPILILTGHSTTALAIGALRAHATD